MSHRCVNDNIDIHLQTLSENPDEYTDCQEIWMWKLARKAGNSA